MSTKEEEKLGNLAAAPRADGTLCPLPYDELCRARRRIKLGDAAGLTQFGVNICTLPPGAWSSQRHWHTRGDEVICHHFQNRSASDAVIMEIGTRVKGDEAFYPDIDLKTVPGQGYAHRDGSPYPNENRRS